MKKVASFFAGVGGIDLGFILTNKVKVVYANEFDSYPADVYEANSDIKVDRRDIRQIQSDEIPDFDILVGGFPCQAFSSEGKREGFLDSKNRGNLCFELFRIIKDKQPEAFFLENVHGLVYHDGGNTLKVILEELNKLGYMIKWSVLNASKFGNVPQNRERIYIVGFKDKNAFNKFQFPDKIELTNTLDKCIDFENKQDDRHYISDGYYKTDKFDKLKSIIKKYSVYRIKFNRIEKKADNIAFCLMASSYQRANRPIVKDNFGMRFITPREAFNLQGFPKTFILPETSSDARLMKAAGNSVCVSVIKRIADKIFEVI